MSDDSYLLGDDGEELVRLGMQHRVWSEVSHAAWRRGQFCVGDRILDLGCGPGYCALELAQWVGPQGRVIAVDQSAAFLDTLQRRAANAGVGNIETVCTGVHELELAAHSLDGAFARWLFCFVREPGPLITRVADALKPGAALVTLDYFNYRAFTLAPRSRALDEIVIAIQRHFRDSGGNLDVQGDVPQLMVDAGLRVTQVRQISQLTRPGTPRWHWVESFLRGYLPVLVELDYVDAQLVESFWRDWRACAAHPGAYMYPPPVVEIHGVQP